MPSPIVICGHRAEMADKVAARMAPDYETIHVVLTADAGATELPSLLSGAAPGSSESTSGAATHNYAAPPVAVLVSATYTDDDVSRMREACVGAEHGVPWLRPDIAAMKAEHAGDDGMPALGSDEHADIMCGRMKDAFKRLETEGRLGEDSVVWF